MAIISDHDNTSTKQIENGTNSVKNNLKHRFSILDIIKKDPKEFNDLTLLEYETNISSYLNNYIKQHENDKVQVDLKTQLPTFIWLMSASMHLCNNIGLQIEQHIDVVNSIKKGYFPRSSYKFCEFGYECEFNYNNNHKGCYLQHYVHNLVCSDLDVVIKYIKELHNGQLNLIQKKKNQYDSFNFTELCKSMKTIAYVIKHMYEELINVKYRYCQNNDANVDKFHKNNSATISKVPQKKHTKNNKQKFNK